MTNLRITAYDKPFWYLLSEPSLGTVKLWYDDFTGEFYPSMAPIVTPRLYTTYSIHYVLEGEGYFDAGDGNLVTLSAGDAFFICPDMLVSYYPNPKNPWKYCGMCSGGGESKELCKQLGYDRPFYVKGSEFVDVLGEEIITIINSLSAGTAGRYDMLIAAYRIMSILEKKHNVSPQRGKTASRYVREAKEYIKEHYSSVSLRIPEVAESLSLSHSYLCRIFREQTGSSAEDYLVNYRMSVAKRLLSETDFSIGEVAFLCGYADPSHFSKAYRIYSGNSPRTARKILEEKAKAQRKQ